MVRTLSASCVERLKPKRRLLMTSGEKTCCSSIVRYWLRAFLRERDRRFIDRLPVDIAITESVPAEERIVRRKAMVDAPLSEVLVCRLQA